MTTLATPRHRVSAATAQMRDLADTVVDASVWSMTAAEAGTTLVELTRLEAQVAELKSRVAAHADDQNVGEDTGASSTANWLAHQTQQTRPVAHATVQLGHDLEQHPITRDALAAGDLVLAQARVILQAVRELPDNLDADLVTQAEAHLVAEAQHHDAQALRLLGRRLLEVVAPDEADAYEAQAGSDAARPGVLRADRALPRRSAPPGGRHQRHRRRHHVPRVPDRGPRASRCAGHRRTHLPRTGPQAGLPGRNPGRRPRRQVRGTRPVSKTRLYTEAQRIAMILRDRGCTAEGCDYPPAMCQAHHNTRWADGGTTNFKDGRLLCPWHHAKAHDPRYVTTTHPNGKVAFHRRT